MTARREQPMIPRLDAGGTGSLFERCLGEVRDRLCPDPPVTVVMTDEERAAALIALHNAVRRRAGMRPLPEWFKELPVPEQLRRFREAMERGDHDPCAGADGLDDPAQDGQADGGPGQAGEDLPYGLRERGEDDDHGAAADCGEALF